MAECAINDFALTSRCRSIMPRPGDFWQAGGTSGEGTAIRITPKASADWHFGGAGKKARCISDRLRGVESCDSHIGQGDIVGTSMNLSGKQQSSVLWCFPLLLSLGGCGETGPECGSVDARNSVVRTVADNRNNPLLDYAAKNSDSVDEKVSHANSEAEKSAILEKAKQDATYSLDDTIVMNSRTARAAACTGLLYVKVGDTVAQKEVEFKVEQTADGKISVSVSPFLF